MPRSRSHKPQDLAERALRVFWSKGYEATSMDDLVKATAVSRHGIYSDFGGKHELFLACFEQYQDLIVTPAFSAVEQPEATILDISKYFEHQISLAEQTGLPGPGCFVGNTMTEVAPHNHEVLQKVQQHNDRLKKGFANALQVSKEANLDAVESEILNLAEELVVFATGLWAMSRLTDNAAHLRKVAANYLFYLQRRLK